MKLASGGRDLWSESEREPRGVELVAGALLGPPPAPFVKYCFLLLLIGSAPGEQMIDDLQDRAGHRHGGPAGAPPRGEAFVLSRQLTAFLLGGRVGRIDQDGPQPARALARLAPF